MSAPATRRVRPTLRLRLTLLNGVLLVGAGAILVLLAWLLVRDALRSNDTRLVAAALGPGARDLPAAEWRQGVLKSVFMGLPLSAVDGLAERADTELGRMLAALRHEREAAGRTMPADAVELLERLH